MGKNQKCVISTPNGATVEVVAGKASMRCRIVWDKGFEPKATNALQTAQQMFDQECARRIDPYVPFDTGTLKASVVQASEFGSGELVYNTPYASAQYYLHEMGSGLHGLRGPHWGERMVADHRQALATFAANAVRKGMNR